MLENHIYIVVRGVIGGIPKNFKLVWVQLEVGDRFLTPPPPSYYPPIGPQNGQNGQFCHGLVFRLWEGGYGVGSGTQFFPGAIWSILTPDSVYTPMRPHGTTALPPC